MPENPPEGSPRLVPYRLYTAVDAEGHHWSFATHVKDVAPEDMKPDG